MLAEEFFSSVLLATWVVFKDEKELSAVLDGLRFGDAKTEFATIIAENIRVYKQILVRITGPSNFMCSVF